ncbi:uncharacterized protein H6S33_010139 [Morchella sextelata]|uniref:uncharacterized protein n=1 Tax=Morchella sextelata TaxID=1174677 RepID=UPI001D04C8CD|nr:uncharacterized protein H6S33_010139 [Morchella sextelata]KAH0612087.1 hypothetical protein H6S33_010139 [Morchella sextelata]
MKNYSNLSRSIVVRLYLGNIQLEVFFRKRSGCQYCSCFGYDLKPSTGYSERTLPILLPHLCDWPRTGERLVLVPSTNDDTLMECQRYVCVNLTGLSIRIGRRNAPQEERGPIARGLHLSMIRQQRSQRFSSAPVSSEFPKLYRFLVGLLFPIESSPTLRIGLCHGITTKLDYDLHSGALPIDSKRSGIKTCDLNGCQLDRHMQVSCLVPETNHELRKF